MERDIRLRIDISLILISYNNVHNGNSIVHVIYLVSCGKATGKFVRDAKNEKYKEEIARYMKNISYLCNR